MEYIRRNQGTCSVQTRVELDPDHTIRKVEVLGGCNGNLKGIAALVEGMDIDAVIERVEGIRCGMKSTSCPDQLAKALRAAKEQM